MCRRGKMALVAAARNGVISWCLDRTSVAVKIGSGKCILQRGTPMVVPGRDPMGNHDHLEVAHEEMYRRFLTLTMGAVAVVAVILIMMTIFVT